MKQSEDDSSVLEAACSSETGKFLQDYAASQLGRQLSSNWETDFLIFGSRCLRLWHRPVLQCNEKSCFRTKCYIAPEQLEKEHFTFSAVLIMPETFGNPSQKPLSVVRNLERYGISTRGRWSAVPSMPSYGYCYNYQYVAWGISDSHFREVAIFTSPGHWLSFRITGDFGRYPSSLILTTREHNVSETGSASVFRWCPVIDVGSF
jgi:hypothetical protein